MKPLCWYRYSGGFWFRVFGVGLAFKDTRKHRLLFSERNGYSGRRIGHWFVKVLW